MRFWTRVKVLSAAFRGFFLRKCTSPCGGVGAKGRQGVRAFSTLHVGGFGVGSAKAHPWHQGPNTAIFKRKSVWLAGTGVQN